MRTRCWCLVLAAIVTLTACAKDSSERLTVAASFFPLAEVARAVGGDHATVKDLTPAGVDPHDRLHHTLALQGRADLLVYLGHGFQPELEALAKGFEGGTVDGLEGLPVVDDDPHVWLDPTMLTHIVSAMTDAFVKADPKHRDDYEANAARYRAQLAALDRQLSAGLAECDRNIVVSAHAAWRYFTSRYRLEQEPLAGASGGEPTPERVAELTALVRDAGVTTIFREPLAADGAVVSLAGSTGATTAVLDPVEGVRDDGTGTTYVQVMRRNLSALRTALDCA